MKALLCTLLFQELLTWANLPGRHQRDRVTVHQRYLPTRVVAWEELLSFQVQPNWWLVIALEGSQPNQGRSIWESPAKTVASSGLVSPNPRPGSCSRTPPAIKEIIINSPEERESIFIDKDSKLGISNLFWIDCIWPVEQRPWNLLTNPGLRIILSSVIGGKEHFRIQSGHQSSKRWAAVICLFIIIASGRQWNDKKFSEVLLSDEVYWTACPSLFFMPHFIGSFTWNVPVLEHLLDWLGVGLLPCQMQSWLTKRPKRLSDVIFTHTSYSTLGCQ